jgi:hypothetical protein
MSLKSSPIRREDQKALKDLLNTYGLFKVLVTAQKIEARMAKKMHADAVIQRDLPMLERTISDMRGNHILRSFVF